VGEAEGRTVNNVELQFRVEDGDIDAFLDHHAQYSAAVREIRRRQLYGYVILFAIFGLVFWVFGETAVAIAFLVLGPVWAAWWPTRARRLAREQAAAFYRGIPKPLSDGPHVLRLEDAALFYAARGAETRTPYASTHIESTADLVLVYTSPTQAIVIPRQRVTTGNVDIVVQQLRARSGESR
jgi:hypothetical protein